MIAKAAVVLALLLLASRYVDWRQVRHETGLTLAQWSSQPRRSRLGLRPLVLGSLPLEERGDREALRALGVTRVFSLLEAYEREPGWLWTPITDYGGNATTWYPLADHAPLPTQDMQLYDWAMAIAVAIHTHHVVYVHCRAGVGRSASLVVAYLMLAERLDFPAAEQEVRRWRPQVRLNPRQRNALFAFGDWLEDARDAAG